MSKWPAPCSKDHTGRTAKKPPTSVNIVSSSCQTHSTTRALTWAVAAEASSASEVSQPPSQNPSLAPSLQPDNLVDPSPKDPVSIEFVFPTSAVATCTIPGSFSSPSPDHQASLKLAVSALQTTLATPPNSTSLSAIAVVATLIEASDEDYAKARAHITASMRSSSAIASRLASPPPNTHLVPILPPLPLVSLQILTPLPLQSSRVSITVLLLELPLLSCRTYHSTPLIARL
jgi:hypothetical protein